MEFLNEAKRQQQNKVEELKKKTSYYMTKGLIDRYETPTKEQGVSRPGSAEDLPRFKREMIVSGLQKDSSFLETANESLLESSTLNIISQTPLNNNSNHGQNSTVLNPSFVTPQTISNQPSSSSWLDKLMDALIGTDEGPHHKYALICENCFTHNGLVMPQDYANARITYN